MRRYAGSTVRVNAAGHTLNVGDYSRAQGALDGAAKWADVIVTSGGVSVGRYDFVQDVLKENGEVLFWKISVKPGKPLLYGHYRGKPMFGLPANPASSVVGFELFVKP